MRLTAFVEPNVDREHPALHRRRGTVSRSLHGKSRGIAPLLILGCLLSACLDEKEHLDPLRIPWSLGYGKGEVETSAGAVGDAEVASRVPTRLATGAESLEKLDVGSCLAVGCHADVGQSSELHARVAVGACLVCHEPTGELGDHSFVPVKADGGVCRTCHALALTGSSIHAPFEDGSCLACHDPHARHEGSIVPRDDTADTCRKCHEPREEPVLHGPYRDGDCTSCHAPHASSFAKLTLAPSAELCSSCHDHEIETEAGRILPNMAKLIRSATHPHGPIRNGECTGCHDAHASKNPNLLRKPFPTEVYQAYDPDHYALCFECHDKALAVEEHTTTATGFRDGDRNLHFVHVNREKGRSCRLCHEIHASDQAFHIRRSAPFGIGDWELPIRYRRTQNGGACLAACHVAIRYDRNVPLNSSRSDGTRTESEIEIRAGDPPGDP